MLAVDGSKFEGTGFEKEHIGQIQVVSLVDGMPICSEAWPKAAFLGEDG